MAFPAYARQCRPDEAVLDRQKIRLKSLIAAQLDLMSAGLSQDAVLRTAVLEIAYADHGDEAAPALVVVHGWPTPHAGGRLW